MLSAKVRSFVDFLAEQVQPEPGMRSGGAGRLDTPAR